ncbi:MAG: glucosamine-6-phosphate deaminase [Clostridia bacterium]|nr:glucosamine-6-phosphate deaminase [Clostridia bacterium]
MIRIIYSKTAEEAGINGADVITAQLMVKKNSVLGFATGSSPVGMYKELIKRCADGLISFKGVKTVNLDEYRGLAADHDQSYSYFMHNNLFDHIDIKDENTHLPDGLAKDPEAERARYDAVIESMGGVDVQVLGIGNNGHIGFNEPADFFSNGTVLVDLTDSTIDANSRFFERREDVPTQAYSMGIGQIMRARKIVMIVLGKGKAEILERAFFGKVTPEVPASILQFYPGEVVLCADEEALSVILEKHPEAVEMP